MNNIIRREPFWSPERMDAMAHDLDEELATQVAAVAQAPRNELTVADAIGASATITRGKWYDAAEEIETKRNAFMAKCGEAVGQLDALAAAFRLQGDRAYELIEEKSNEADDLIEWAKKGHAKIAAEKVGDGEPK